MQNFNENIILQNKRVLLKPLAFSDSKELLFFSENEPELWEYSLMPANGKENLEKYLNSALKGKKENKMYPFVVFDKQQNQIAGSTRFYDYQELHNTISIGYTWFGSQFQGTRINKNCKYLMLQQAFEVWNLDRVEFRADFKNKHSIYAMKSIGCVEEGVLRSNCKGISGRRDSIVLSILKEEWFSDVKKRLEDKI